MLNITNRIGKKGVDMNRHIYKYGKLILNIVISIGVLLLFIFLFPKVLSFFMPFVIGGIIAAIANKPVHFLETKLKIKRRASTVVVIVVVIAMVSGIGYFIVWVLIKQSVGFIQYLPDLWKTTQKDFQTIGTYMDRFLIKLPVDIRQNIDGWGAKLSTAIAETIGNIGSSNFSNVGSVVGNIATAIINVVMCALSSYFFIAEKDYLNRFVKEHVPKSFKQRWNVVYNSMLQAVGGYFKAQFRIEIWIYLIVVIGLSILNIRYSLLIGLGIAILDFLPVFGTGTVMVPWAIIRLISGDYVMAIGLLVIWGGGQLIRQFIQPKIMGDSIGMPPIPTLFLLFIGYKFGGVFGMIVAIPIGIIVVNMNQAGIFDTPKMSFRLLVANINKYRRLTEEDISVLGENDTEQSETKTEENDNAEKSVKKCGEK